MASTKASASLTARSEGAAWRSSSKCPSDSMVAGDPASACQSVADEVLSRTYRLVAGSSTTTSSSTDSVITSLRRRTIVSALIPTRLR